MAALNTNIKDTAQGLRVYVLNVHKTHCFTEHLVAVRPAEALRGDTGDSGIREGAWLLNLCVCVRTRTLLLSHSAMPDSVQPQGQWPTSLPSPWNFSAKNIGVGCHIHLPDNIVSQNQMRLL